MPRFSKDVFTSSFQQVLDRVIKELALESCSPFDTIQSCRAQEAPLAITSRNAETHRLSPPLSDPTSLGVAQQKALEFFYCL